MAAALMLSALFVVGVIGEVGTTAFSGDGSSKSDSAASNNGQRGPEAVAAPKTLHCLLELVAYGLVTRSEVWARADGDRQELLAIGDKSLDPPVVTIQKQGTIYAFSRGDKVGERSRLPRGRLGSLGLLAQFETVRRHGQMIGSFDHDSSRYDVYRYVAAAETVEAWIDRATGIPWRWASKAPEGDSVRRSMSVFVNVQTNVSIPDSLLETPKGITWKEGLRFK
jgi:hypothetical protein